MKVATYINIHKALVIPIVLGLMWLTTGPLKRSSI
jgi:hypothetical protein